MNKILDVFLPSHDALNPNHVTAICKNVRAIMRFVNGKMWRGIVSGLLVDGKTAMLVENRADANITYRNIDKYRINAR